MKEAIVVDRQLEAAELEKIRASQATIFTTNAKFVSDVTAVELELSEAEIDECTEESRRYIQQFPQSDFGAKLMSSIRFEEFYPWYCQRFRAYNQLKNDYLFYKKIETVLEKFESVELLGNTDSLWKKFHTGASVVKIVGAAVSGAPSSKSAKKAFSKLFLRRAVGQAFKSSGLGKPKHIILSNTRHHQPILDLKELKLRKGNPYLEYLFDVSDGETCILEYANFPAQTDSVATVKGARSEGYGGTGSVLRQDWIMLKGMLNPAFWSKYKNLKKQWRSAFAQMREEQLSPMDSIVLECMIRWNSISQLCLIYYLTTSSWLKKKHSKVLSVSCIGESNSEVRGMLTAFRKYNIPTVGIMHGTIHEANMHYSYAKEEMQFAPVPDYYMVWGDFWKEQLQRLTKIEADRVFVTGQIRTDVIPALNSSVQTTKNAKLNVVFATQPFRDITKRVEAAEAVFEAVAKLPTDQIEFIVKPHPAETNNAFFTDIAQRVGLNELTIIRDKDLYNQLAECDVLLTCYSTVGGEAVYFEKHVITIDFDGKDLQNYATEGVATAIASADELVLSIQKILDGSTVIDTVKYKQFITKYACKIDGKSSQRTLDAIKSIGNKV